MNLQQLALLAEVAGGIGVIASLIYLAIQIRHNTKTVAANTFQAISSASSNMGMQAIQTPELVKVISKSYSESASLTIEEMMLLEIFLGSMLRNYENYYYQYRRGFLEEELWVGYRNTILQFVSTPWGRDIWERHQNRYAADFVAFMNSALEAADIKFSFSAAKAR